MSGGRAPPSGRTQRQGRQVPRESLRLQRLHAQSQVCTTNSQGRSVNRYPGDEFLEKVRAYAETEPYRKALGKRKVWVEPLFAEAKMWHGLCRFRLRTLRRVNAEALLIAAGQNLKRLLAFGHRRPKEPAQVAALGQPATPNRGLRHLRQRRAERFGAPQRSFCNTLVRFRYRRHPTV